ncbi:MAG: aminoacyl-histidine dipeptidase [Candidatus Riflebacteria bacterium HGW-Riflebacteria-2]|jgi:dipeptidase D|nr:MAG: aminoacyl-histidine dipeptidase [Candidatus Riflebacteria bacterium HGW-Riflebacteria-2]
MAKEIKKPAKAAKPVTKAAPKKIDASKPVKQAKTEKPAAKKSSFQLDTTAQRIIDTFEQISAIPRESGNEEQIRHFLIDWARSHKFLYITDKAGNLIIKIAASKGMEKHPTIVLQGHLDMVCEKTPDSDHDFSKDPIRFVYDGEWLKADRTTLGADNGIAIAMAMCLATDSKVKHGPLELLFTIEEETGLTGARGLETGIIEAKYLINIDSERDDVFTVGCAGGKDTHIEFDLGYEEVPYDYRGMHIKVSGLTGGHSGENIIDERANAIRLLVRILHSIRDLCDLRLTWVKGGTAHNAIPRDAEATFFAPIDRLPEIMSHVAMAKAYLKSEFERTDPELNVLIAEMPITPDRRAMMSYITMKALDLLYAMPHGVVARSTDMPHLVETSSNLAKAWIDNGKLFIHSSQRSSVMTRLDAITHRIEAIARLAGARVQSGAGYPSWRPDFNSKLLSACKKIYKSLFGSDPKVEAIHAGLECGLIGNLHPGMQMISLGPTIKNPHSPDERMYLPSINKIYKLLIQILAEL